MSYIKIAGTNDSLGMGRLNEENFEHGVDCENDLGNVIQKAVDSGRFSSESRVGLLEASAENIYYEPQLSDDTLFEKLHENSTCTAHIVKVRTFFIRWASFVPNQNDSVFAISSTAFSKLCAIFDVPILFLKQMLEDVFWIKHGNGLFLNHNEQGQSSKLEIFYRYSYGLQAGRSFMYTAYDFAHGSTTNICINLNPTQIPLLERLTRNSLDNPLALHCLTLSGALDAWILESGKSRGALIKNENMSHDANPKHTTLLLHRLSQHLHIRLEDMSDIEERILLIQEANDLFGRESSSLCSVHQANHISYLLSRCRTSKRWISNYKDRANIRINLAFHLSTQVDNDLNLQISKATTALAKDAQRDSSSMITIAAVTMFFLPGTFISAIFSMTFFNFQIDNSGHEQFQVSKRWWYFLVATIPLTALVFAVWIIWQKIRIKKFREEDVTEKRRVQRAEQMAFGQDFDDDDVTITLRSQEKRGANGGRLLKRSAKSDPFAQLRCGYEY